MKLKAALAAASTIGALACGGINSCVSRGSRVRTPRGERLIEELQVGDELLCVDPDTGRSVPARLVAIRTARRECVSFGFAGGALRLTSDHPVYCPLSKSWHPAGDWALGKRAMLLEVHEERVEPTEVTSASTYAGIHDVFDLTVDHPLHNFVANGVLVHNKSPLPPSCPGQDGGTVTHGAACACQDGGTGCRVTCPDLMPNGTTAAICAPPTGGADGGV